jgi:hypothetical protein
LEERGFSHARALEPLPPQDVTLRGIIETIDSATRVEGRDEGSVGRNNPLTETVTIPAPIENGSLRLDAPLPADLERVEVRGYRAKRPTASAIGELIAFLEGLPAGTRTKEDIDHQVEGERSSWR